MFKKILNSKILLIVSISLVVIALGIFSYMRIGVSQLNHETDKSKKAYSNALSEKKRLESKLERFNIGIDENGNENKTNAKIGNMLQATFSDVNRYNNQQDYNQARSQLLKKVTKPDVISKIMPKAKDNSINGVAIGDNGTKSDTNGVDVYQNGDNHYVVMANTTVTSPTISDQTIIQTYDISIKDDKISNIELLSPNLVAKTNS